LEWLPFPIAPLGFDETAEGDNSTFDITFSNVGREFQSLLEFYEIEGREGRVLWVDAGALDDSDACDEIPFTIQSARVVRRDASITVTPCPFDPLDVQLPRELVTHAEFPGILGVYTASLLR
jgi:hypothetical protein